MIYNHLMSQMSNLSTWQGACPTAAMPGTPWASPKPGRVNCRRLWSLWAKVGNDGPGVFQLWQTGFGCAWNFLVQGFVCHSEAFCQKRVTCQLNTWKCIWLCRSTWGHFQNFQSHYAAMSSSAHLSLRNRFAGGAGKSYHLEQHGHHLCLWTGVYYSFSRCDCVIANWKWWCGHNTKSTVTLRHVMEPCARLRSKPCKRLKRLCDWMPHILQLLTMHKPWRTECRRVFCCVVLF